MGARVSLYLADACALIEFYGRRPGFPARVRSLLEDEPATVAVAATTVWEMSIKAALGKLTVPEGLREELQQQGFTELAVTVDDGLAAGALPRHHDDPFDRVLIAQAARRGLELLTVDRRFGDYDVRLL